MRVLARTSARLSVFSAAALLLCSLSAKANVITISVTNGSFTDLTTPGVSGKLGTNSGENTVIGWTSNNNSTNVQGYNFVYTGTSTTNQNGQYGNASGISLWGTANGVANGIGTSPDGGNFIAMDGAYEQGTLSQVLTGLTIGMDTKVYFYYAGAQQSGFTGATTEAFTVGLTNTTTGVEESHSTGILNNVDHGFTGWHYTYVDFVPTATTETLSFLAAGTPGGVPPFSLLDGISVVQVTPEPSTLALLGTGVLAVGGMLRRRRQATV